MFVDTTHRSKQIEIMDDFSMEGDLLGRTLNQLDWINKWLGGNRITLLGLKNLFQGVPKDRELTIVDLGCGSGDMLRIVADYARNTGRKVKLIGIDANEFTLNFARDRSKDYPEISYILDLVPSANFTQLKYDIVLSTLFLHHFSDEEIKTLLTEITKRASIGMVINDLHRSTWAYFLFKLLTIFIPNPMVRQDGLTSILRGFKKTELQHFADQLGLTHSLVKWRWAFRFEWTIKKQ